ncbi:uncharacterized protein LOC121771312 [Salvia splendens]|uniref:uncharacterized protein LOC121771312 n=1 Tax=Salvia splendens TaxID=180675 RepID=UPI001C25A870|nr:uncharacterized protein LOC121771312 [Salvia splendens]
MSSNLLGYDNSLLFYDTSQPHFHFESAPEIDEKLLIVPELELELSFSSAHEFMQSYYCQNELNFDFDGALLESASSNEQKEKTNSDGVFKVGKYSKEERKLRIDRYKAKRTRRNFNKTIKYACRKTLADSRQRIRGRFVRNDEAEQILQPSLFQSCQHKYHLWIDDWLVS